MTFLKSALVKGALAATLASGALVTMVPATASADVVCNRFNECWQTRDYDRDDYPRLGLGFTFHSDDWRYHHRGYYHWRRYHDDRGYYRNGIWITF